MFSFFYKTTVFSLQEFVQTLNDSTNITNENATTTITIDKRNETKHRRLLYVWRDNILDDTAPSITVRQKRRQQLNVFSYKILLFM